jgi:predicted nicotinamide N-methyase
MPDGSNIVIREASFSEAFLGWETWNAAIVFSHWIYKNKEIIENAKVIELGCGTSLAGIACARNGAKHVHLTDHNENILKYAQYNADENACGDKVTVSHLDWNDVIAGTPAASAHDSMYDVVVGTGTLLALFNSLPGDSFVLIEISRSPLV